MFGDNQKGLIRGLIYGIQFTPEPNQDVDRVIDGVVRRRAMGASPEEYAAAVDAALKSTDDLSTLLPQPHSDAVLRSFLTEIARSLAEERRSGGD